MERQEFDPSFFKVSWIMDLLEKGNTSSFVLSNYKPNEDEKKYRSFGVCSAPGKKLAKGRDGKVHDRSIETDVKYFREFLKIDIILCLLDNYELRTIGVDLAKYKKACEKQGIELICYPIVEMACPNESPNNFDKNVIIKLVEAMCNRKRVVCHCRGGIGRAGTIASCLLIKLGLVENDRNAISTVRELRDPKAVESKKQEDYIKAYSISIKKLNSD